MTMNSILPSACLLVAADSADHLRITTCLAEGKMDRAIDLTLSRMKTLLTDYSEDIDCRPEGALAVALEVMINSHGPRLMVEMKIAARRHIRELTR